MRYAGAVLVLLLLNEAGVWFAQSTNLPVSGSLMGMVVLLLLLAFMGRVPHALGRSSHGLLRHFMLLFIPSVAAVMLHVEVLKEQWLAFVLSCIAGGALTLLVSAWTLRWMQRRMQRARHDG
jgi:holin-like protein